MQELIVDSIRLILPAIAVAVAVYLAISQLMDGQTKMRRMELGMEEAARKHERQQENLPLRLQAYERLVLFLERISPQNIILRVEGRDQMSARELQMILVMMIRQEFEHNITQQLYVSQPSWTVIQNVTEELVTIINSLGQQFPPEAKAKELSRAILQHFIQSNEMLPTQRAIDMLKAEGMALMT